jgi:tape measure domain-containing protein
MVLNDGISGVLRKINTALNTTLNAFEQVQRASGRAVDTAQIQAARAALVQANREVDEMAEGYRRAAEQEEILNKGLRNGTNAAGGLLGKVKGIVATLAAGAGIKALLGLSDKMTSTTARLNFLVDDGGSVEALEQKIMASAQRSRAAYLSTAEAVSKLGLAAGDAFSSNDELIAFTELVNKNLTVGGASATEQAAAMYQLTQAMSSGRLQGDEYRSIIENAPLLASAIEDYMRNVQGAEGAMKDWAAEGLLTADVIKAALFTTADEVEARFNSMPMTWGQVWTQMGNVALKVLDPVLTGINWLANNISIIAPLVLGLGAAFLVFQVAAHWTQIASAATAVYHGVVNFLSIGFGVLTGNTAAASAAVFTFNSALLASPITWIIMLIIALIALLYGVVAVINKVTGSSISATGLICGAVAVAGAFIGNLVIAVLNNIINAVWSIFVAPFLGIVEWVLNVCNGGFNSFGGAVANLIGQIIGWFLNLGKVVTTIIDAIFGTNWTAGLENLQSQVTAWGKNENAITLDKNAPLIEHRFNVGDAWAAGNDFGKGIDEKVGSFFNVGTGSDLGLDAFSLDDITANTGQTAANTGAAVDALSTSAEELAYLRDIAEREAVNRFTTAEVRVEQTISNNISNSADLDGVISTLTDGFTEALLTAAEGVHA